MELADPGITTKPRGLTASQSRPADISTAAAVPGRSAALDVCVASSIAAAARGDAAQAAFDRKLSHYRNEIGELRQQNIHLRSLVWTADGRPHRAAASTRRSNASVRGRHRLQPKRAASVGETPSSQVETRNPNSSPAPEARALLPNPSALAEWLFAGITDRALHHWGHVPALDGGPGGHDFLRLTQQYLTTTMTLPPWRATRTNLCGHQSQVVRISPVRVGGVVSRRWLFHAVSRPRSVRSVSGQYPSSTEQLRGQLCRRATSA